MKKINNIHKTMSIFLSCFCESVGIKLVIRGNRAYCDGEKVVLPEMSNSINSKIAKTVTLGFAIHEGSHVNFTDIKYIIDRKLNENELIGKILNYIEDTYIEKKQISLHPKTLPILAETAKFVLVEGADNENLEYTYKNLITSIANFFVLYARSKIPGQEFLIDSWMIYKNKLNEYHSFDVTFISEFIDEKLNSFNIKSSQDSYRVTLEFKELLNNELVQRKKEAEDNKKSEKSENSQGNSQSEKGENSQGNSQSEKGENSQSNSQSEKGENSQSNSQSEKGENSQGNSQSEKGENSQGNSQSEKSENSQGNSQSEKGESSEQGNSQSEKGEGSENVNNVQDEKINQINQALEALNAPSLAENLEKNKEESSSNNNNFDDNMLSDNNDDSFDGKHNVKQTFSDEFSNALNNAINKMIAEAAASFDKENDFKFKIADSCKINEKKLLNDKSHFDEVLRKTSKLRLAFNEIIVDELDVDYYESDRGKINSRRLYRSAFGSDIVFKLKDKDKEINTDIHIIGDLSYSMAGESQTVMDSLYAIGCSLEGVPDTSVAISIFGPFDDDVYEVSKRNSSVKNNYFKFCGDYCRGGTPTDSALGFAVKELSTTISNKKIVIVITDGLPNNYGNTLEMIKYIEKSDIIVIGIGIGPYLKTMVNQNPFNELFSKGIIVESIETLAQNVLTISKKYF